MENKKESECCIPHQIVTEFSDKILGYIVKRVNDVEAAKDITQEVMGRLIDAYDKQLPIDNVQAWLFQVTRNIIADRYRKKDVLNYADTDVDIPNESEEFNLTAEDFIIPMIKLLPEEHSIPLMMSDIENLKQSDIAEKLNLSLSATKMRCQRGRKKLYELFIECCDIKYTENGSFAHCTFKPSCDVLIKEEENLNRNK